MARSDDRVAAEFQINPHNYTEDHGHFPEEQVTVSYEHDPVQLTTLGSGRDVLYRTAQKVETLDDGTEYRHLFVSAYNAEHDPETLSDDEFLPVSRTTITPEEREELEALAADEYPNYAGRVNVLAH